MRPERGPTPVTLVAGFLGAGKTTLLRHLLAAEHGRRIGVVVNDFGALDIDAELIREVHGETGTVRLTNGCICCTIRGDLLESAAHLTALPDAPEWIVIEASGVSDPHAIAATFSLAELATIARLDGVVTVLDAEGWPALGAEPAALACAQLEAADLVLLNKIDLVSSTERAAVRADIERTAPTARILECAHARVPAEVLLADAARPARRRVHEDGATHAHTDHGVQFASFTWESERALDAERLRDAILEFPRSVLRGKGFVHTLQAPEEAGEFHLVGRRASLTRGPRWRGVPRTRLVFIGEKDDGARAAVTALLDRVRAAD